MRRHLIIAGLMSLICIFCWGTTSWCQNHSAFEVGGFAGQSFWKSKTFEVGPPQADPSFSMQYKYDDKLLFGARANFLSYGHWGGEFAYSFQNNRFTLTRSGNNSVSLDGNINQFFYNQIYYINRYEKSTVHPFLTGGVGISNFTIDQSSLDWAADPNQGAIGVLKGSETKFAMNYGGGVKVNLGSHFGVRGDFRHSFSQVPHYGLPESSSSPAQVVFPVKGWMQNFEVTGGFYYRTSK
jgi:hypothetical protein